MTFKSTPPKWWQLVEEGKLVRFMPPLDPDEAAKRTFLLLPKHHLWLVNRVGSESSREYRSQVRAAIGEFVRGEPITDDNSILKLLQPPRLNAWVYRITFAPHARIIGCFAGHDVFVGLERRFRHELEDGAYDDARDRALSKWQQLFGSTGPLMQRSLGHCISNVGVGNG